MSRRIIKSELALADLEEQAEYIRQRSPAAALRFLDGAEALFRQLAAMPGIGERFESTNPLLDDLRRSSIPKFPSIVAYYRPLEDGIIVIRVLHGARDIERILGQGGPDDEI